MTAPTLGILKVKLFTDGADKAQIVEMAKHPWIAGFTTNPSLMKKASVSDYEAYARDLVGAVPDRHFSFEVFSDAIPEMVAQARVITSWGAHVYVKLPVTNTRGEPLFDAVRALSHDGVKVNMTAIFTAKQVTREVFNVVEAESMGCHIITAPADVLKKLPGLGKMTDAELSLAAVKSFREDAIAAGLRLSVAASRAAE
ncbi:MAG: transaldolase family protein [Pseudolabrys sp.]